MKKFTLGLILGLAVGTCGVLQAQDRFKPYLSGGLLTQTDERAPNSKDVGVFWAYKNGSTISLYFKDWITGDWRGPVNF